MSGPEIGESSVDGPFALDAVSGLVAGGPGRFAAAVDPAWTIGGKPNGGYLLAMMGRAATLSSRHKHLLAASAHYLHSPDPGGVTIEVDVLRAGRTASQVRARMSQDGKPCVEALVTVGHLDADAVPYWDRGLPPRGGVDREGCVRLVPRLPTGMPAAIMEQIDVRLEPDSYGFASGHPRDRGELRGWLALVSGDPFDPASLLFAVDSFPPATFDIEMTGWVPTLELTAYIRALPAPGPLAILQRAQLVDGQRVDEVCFVWDSTGRLVAQGTQLAGIRLG